MMSVPLLRLLCISVSIGLIISEQYVELAHFPSSSISETCLEVCQYNGYECYDNVLQESHCPSAASEICGRSAIEDQSHAYQCDKGGCYVDCNNGVFADRGQSYLTCYSSPICHASNNDYSYMFTKICTCAIVTTTPPKALHVYLWELIGMAALLLFLVGAAVVALYYFFPGIFPSWDSMMERLGVGKNSPPLAQRIAGCVGGVAEYFAVVFQSMSNAVSSSYSNLADTSTSGASEESRRRRRERRSRRKQSDSNELDVSQDMQIG